MDLSWWVPLAFFAVALAYSAVGFGGGSSYIALLAVVGFSYLTIPQTALICNLVVTAGGMWHYYRGGHLDFRRVAPFVALSVPAAYLGGRFVIGENLFFMLLGVSLAFAGARAFIAGERDRPLPAMTTRTAWCVGLPVGAALGFLSGLVGIGGGVFLAPVLLLSGWGRAKQVAAAASVFIAVNSAAGLFGQLSKGVYVDLSILPLVVAVIAGGQIGARAGSYRMPVVAVQRLLATLILVVGLRLIWRVL